ncbi:MAG: hypothetical protein ACYTFY_07710 [Planctomycetota bacterium]
MATRTLQPVAALDEFEGDPITLSTVKSVAIFPVENATGSDSFDSISFSTKMANQLASRGIVRVIFPRQVVAETVDLNKKIERHNRELTKLKLLGKDPAKERSEKLLKGIPLTADRDVKLDMLDPVKKLSDAIKVGRILGVDAVLMGKVTDFDPYYRPRISVTLQAVATGHSAQAAESLKRLTQWGIPNSHRNQHGVAWYRQQVFDTQDGGTSRDLYLFARNHHTENRPFDTEIYMRSMDRFYEFVGGTLAFKFLDARDFSAKAAMDKAIAEAKKRKLDREKMMSKVRSLVYPDRKLPSERTVAEKNIMDRRERSWRPDIHGRAFPEDVNNTSPEAPKGAYFRKK